MFRCRLPVFIAVVYACINFTNANRKLPNREETCFEGFTLSSNGLCVQDVREIAERQCPAGVLTEGDRCRIQVSKKNRCEGAAVLNAQGECYYITESPPEYYCPAGFIDAGDDCVQSTPGDILEVCINSDRVDDHCVKRRKEKPTTRAACPDGTRSENGICWRTIETFDCTEDYVVATKKHGSGQSGNNNHRQLNRASPVLENLVPATAPQQYKVFLVSQMCEKRAEIPPVIQTLCPDGFLLEGKTCVMEEILPIHYECAATGGLPQTCPSTVNYTSKVKKCSQGADMVKGRCQTQVLAEPVRYCPAGFTDIDDKCEGFVEAPIACPVDLTLKNGWCVGRRMHQPIVFAGLKEQDVIV